MTRRVPRSRSRAPGGLAPHVRRVVVFGQSASGKTTLALAIARSLGVPHIDLDALHHRANWEPTPDEEFRAEVSATLDANPEGWVVDGNYRVVRGITLPRADTIVRLRLPFRVVYPRLLWRTVRRVWTQQELWNGNHESFRLSFMRRRSILVWGATHWRAHTRHLDTDLREIPHCASVIELWSKREVDGFVRSLSADRVIE